ncbi:methyltransferase domain-containing protein [Sulfurovum lithotrophicum]|nr:methyltransferase domain-containing protein [Sulfurovum lithotrophicum]
MQEILLLLQQHLEIHDTISFSVLHPDLAEGYAGTLLHIDGETYLYRSLKAWSDLAELLHCRMLMPKEGAYPMVTITFKKLETESSFHLDTPGDKEEKYGVTSKFFTIHKMEEPSFYYYYQQALENVTLEKRHRVLDLGVNRGDEFEVIRKQLNIHKYESMDFVGIDHSATAIEYADGCFPEENVTFYAYDINKLDDLNLGTFDLLISIGTLQSPGINFKPFFMSLVQNYLEKDAAVILGFPNSRWIGGEMVYGAKAPNYAMSEMSLLFNDVMFVKKYLQQKKYRVTITGKHYLFLTATKIRV